MQAFFREILKNGVEVGLKTKTHTVPSSLEAAEKAAICCHRKQTELDPECLLPCFFFVSKLPCHAVPHRVYRCGSLKHIARGSGSQQIAQPLATRRRVNVRVADNPLGIQQAPSANRA